MVDTMTAQIKVLDKELELLVEDPERFAKARDVGT